MSNSVKYGLYSGLVLTIYSLVIFISDSSLRFNSNLAWVAVLLVPMVFMVLGTMAEKKDQGGFISFGEAFKTCFLIFLVSIIVSTISSMILFQFYSDADWETMAESQRSLQKSMLEAAGADEVTIEEALDQASPEAFKEQMNNPLVLIIGMLTNCFIGLLLSLIPAAILKNAKN